jgi:urease accessory protein
MTGPEEAPASLLSALRLADSALPVGGFTASYGLESFLEEGLVEDGEELRALLETYLTERVGPSEMVALRAAHEAAVDGDLEGVAAVDRRLRAMTLAREARESSTRSGGKLLELLAATEADDTLAAYAGRAAAGEVPGNYAVALGLAAGRLGVPAREAALALAHSFVTGLLGAAQRLGRFGHTEIQAVLRELQPVMAAAWTDNADRPVEEMRAFTPEIELLSARHERAERRLFVS